MYKWHVHSAIGRGRPIGNDFSKAVDGIAASLRQFSISASRSAEDDDGPRVSRSQKSAEAFKEVASLAPTPARGIDARSLAAKPPPTFTIRRLDQSGSNRTETAGGGASAPPRRVGFPGGARGGAGMRGRGRGGARGSGARGRGRGAKQIKPQKRAPKADEEDYIEDPYSEEELAYLEMSDGGFPANYIPETSSENLARYGPAVMSSPRGIRESIANRFMVAVDNKDPSFEHASFHLARMHEGLGTLFENAEQRALTEEYHGGKKFGSLSEKQKDSIMRQWVAGQYKAPGKPVAGNVVGLARQMTRMNGTYLPEDAQKFERTLRSLLPQNMKQAEYEKPDGKAAPAQL